MSIRYNDYDLPLYSASVDILEYLGGEEPTEDEVWLIARESEKVPVFENILQREVFMRLDDILTSKGIECEYFINAHDTYFSLSPTQDENIPIHSFEQFKIIMIEMDVCGT